MAAVKEQQVAEGVKNSSTDSINISVPLFSTCVSDSCHDDTVLSSTTTCSEMLELQNFLQPSGNSNQPTTEEFRPASPTSTTTNLSLVKNHGQNNNSKLMLISQDGTKPTEEASSSNVTAEERTDWQEQQERCPW